MKKIVSGLFGVAVVVMGCVREIGPEESDPKRDFLVLSDDEITLLAQREIPPRLDSGEIGLILDDVRRLLDNAVSCATSSPPATRSAPAARTVARVRPLTVETAGLEAAGDGTTRGAVTPDTLFHIVDFDDGQGYCIVAADRRLPDPVVCFVENGSFPDEVPGGEGGGGSGGAADNPGLAVMIAAVRNYALRSLSRHREWSDSVATALLTRTGAASLDEIDLPDHARDPSSTRLSATPYRPSWQFNRRVGPLLPVEWGQSSPFNATVVENTQWKTTPAGCVALAAVQVMAYWKHPASIDGLDQPTIDWDELRRWSGSQWNRKNGYGEWDGPMSAAPDDTQRLVADILWHVGSEIGMRYGQTISTAYTIEVVKLLAGMGFSRGRSTKYTHRTVVEQLGAGRPVMIDAASHRSEHGSYANAHAWVIDGFMEDRWWDAYTLDRHLYLVERFRWFLHNNFGWSGTDNGYYAAGVFDANNNPDLPSSSDTIPPDPDPDDADPGTRTGTRAETKWEGQSYNYQFMQTIYVDIYK